MIQNPEAYANVRPAYPGVEYLDMPKVLSTPQDFIKFSAARANSLKHSFQDGKTLWSEVYRECIDHPALSHHGQNHCRPVELVQRAGTLSYLDSHPEFLNSPTAFATLSAGALFPYGHDLDQLTGSRRNLNAEKNGEKPVKEKKGHALGAAVMHLAMTRRYQQENDIDTFEEAYEITSRAAIMMMRHDEPEKFDRTFSETNTKAYQIGPQGEVMPLNVEQLRSHYDNDTLDLFSMSPAQCLALLRDIKVDNKFIDANTPGFGLSSEFEAESAEDLVWLADNHRPIGEHWTREEKNEVKTIGRLCNWADMAHMISPYTEQFMRTFQTAYSMQRPFSIFNHGNKDLGIEAHEISVDEAWEMIMTKGGNDLPADDLRLIWEMKQSAENEEFADVEWIHEFTKEHAIMSALCLQRIGFGIMDDNMEEVEAIFVRKQDNLLQKITGRGDEGYKYNGLYSHPKEEIVAERLEVIGALSAPRKQREYSHEDKFKHAVLVHRLIEWLKLKYQLSEPEFQDYVDRVNEWKPAETQPFHASSLPRKDLKRMKPAGYTNGNGASNGHGPVIL